MSNQRKANKREADCMLARLGRNVIMEKLQLERNAQELSNIISEGRLVLFCGAGISMDYPACLERDDRQTRRVR